MAKFFSLLSFHLVVFALTSVSGSQRGPSAHLNRRNLPSENVPEQKSPLGKSEAEVFFLAGPEHNKHNYTKAEGAAACALVGARLATKAELQTGWERGASWCSSGWLLDVGGGYYPNAIETHLAGCGNKKYGLVGPWNSRERFGANCFGVKPAKASEPGATHDMRGFNRFIWSSGDRTNDCAHTLNGLICS
ncbi:hypothetical protein BV898_12146 [Hypsibius exemplaris]|uniref:Link domain-containing protein n=1 Tax=Hypsibius exemplaris TaxID=2072580 RepID=A0A1W0WEP9_HYPEX|nr:hypothetical protein BV898_12146 [Hypsibius exemplaris]